MKYWERFKTRKERGDWVELLFMAQAAKHRFAVYTPWGGMRPCDVGIEHEQNFLRVQVKSTTHQVGGGYRCQFRPQHRKMSNYNPQQLDLFAAYVIPADVWYLVPASLLLGTQTLSDVMLSPIGPPVKKKSYCYECYREAWGLLTKSRRELARYG